MQPAPQKQSEVVYRKTGSGSSAGPTSFAERARGYAPAIMPLIVGFLLLLAVILVLSLHSASQMNNVASNARIETQRYSERLNRLLQLRLSLITLESEARLRDLSVSNRQITPPLQVRLDEARREATEAVRNIETVEAPPPPASTMFTGTQQQWLELWQKLKVNLPAYIELTKDAREYNE